MRKEKHHKGWNEIKTNDSWAIFKIMGEFVMGFEKMSAIGPCVTIFGSARTKSGHHYYELAVYIAKSFRKQVTGLSQVVAPVLWKQVTEEPILQEVLLLGSILTCLLNNMTIHISMVIKVSILITFLSEKLCL